MEESELTRKAIEELMREMDECKEKEITPTERKKNPLGKPNKLFLGRTINSIMNYNKREADRNLQRCERKLKELDSKKSRRESTKDRKDRDVDFKYFHEVIGSDNSSVEFSIKRRRKKKRKKNYRSSSTSSNVTNSSSNLSSESKIKRRKKKRYKKEIKEDYGKDFHSNFMGFYVDPNMAYAAMAYSEMSRLLHQQQLQEQFKVDEELREQSLEIPSDLSISCHSSPESSLNISLHSSSAEEDENGVLTFKLSSDDDEKLSFISQNAVDKNKKDCDEESLHSHISLDSKDSENHVLKQTHDVYELSSSDSDELEIVETNLANISN